jgi:hypothetical protein
LEEWTGEGSTDMQIWKQKRVRLKARRMAQQNATGNVEASMYTRIER